MRIVKNCRAAGGEPPGELGRASRYPRIGPAKYPGGGERGTKKEKEQIEATLPF